ncbi:MAG: PAS domain-containing protein [Fibrobacteria bacterium]|nr:PAS domain-containing protein [Fibrobacteria bacterium]
MKKIQLFWNLYPAYFIIIVIGFGLTIWFSTYTYRQFSFNQTRQDMASIARISADRIQQELKTGALDIPAGICEHLSVLAQARVTIIEKTGNVVCDSEKDSDAMDNHKDRPEFIDAREEGEGMSMRYSRTLNQDMMYVAEPLMFHTGFEGIVRISVPLTSIQAVLNSVRNKLLLAGVFTAIFVAVMSWFLSRHIIRPLEQMRKGAENFSKGLFKHRMPQTGSVEMSTLAHTMNNMADDLGKRMRTIRQQRSELDAVFSSMEEGVIAVDEGNCIFTFNPSAAKILNISPTDALGKNILKIVRKTQLLEMLERILSFKETLKEDLIFTAGNEERYLQIHGTRLLNEGGDSIGALIVMNDVTKLKQLENIRRDFVANVSHELKTPITSIKGAVETLNDGAMQNPKDAARFLKMIAQNGERLHQIIEDLLSLSRIEQNSEEGKVEREPTSVQKIVENAINACDMKALNKHIQIMSEFESDCELPVNPQLMEEAVINLIDNALKYSNDKKTIRVRVTAQDGECRISVIDQGSGISDEHLPRLFERFYRVDKARSRKIGGTGLGLAIVKHILQVHKGHVSVESEVGKGSSFTLHLPLLS